MSPHTATSPRPPVLVVDDEYGPRESIAYSLSQSFDVDTASRASEALAKVREKRYDAVVMDIRMPEMDGIRAVTELRKIDSHVSVIMLTGYGTLQTAQQAMLAGANQYLRKPPDVIELLDAVAKQASDARLRRTQADAAREAVKLNAALRQEMSEVAPAVWLGKASAELVHDLSNPLTIVIGYANLLLMELQAAKVRGVELPVQIAEYTDVIKNSAEYCRHLAQNWRRASGEVPRMELIDLFEVVMQTKSLLFENEKGIELIGSGHYFIKASKFEIMRVVQNVLKNSIEAGSKVIRVRIERPDEFNVAVVVDDNGGGMDENQRKAIDSAGVTFKPNGTGLGLGICRHIVSAHGGTFAISSVFGVGTSVRITFPFAALK